MPGHLVRAACIATRIASATTEVSALAIFHRPAHMNPMSNAPQIAEIASLVGDPARTNILCALLGGRALTATELAFASGVTPQTASGHLGKLLRARLLVLAKQGRHRYYRLAGPSVAQMLESIMNVAMDAPPRYQPRSRADDAMRRARTCYDHIAGELGVALADRLSDRGHVVLGEEAGEVTPDGAEFLEALGVDLSAAAAKRRVFCRPCVDWTERRPHIGGAVGAALASRCFEMHWVERVRDSRALSITAAGRRGLAETFGLRL
jgi:DNA-binding transcriptional ArsR family regulator